MTDDTALLAAILAHPDEDTPRLVYADWLDENGEHDRAEFVRVQVELARRGDHRHHVTEGHPATVARWCGVCQETADLRRRERELEYAHFRSWFPPLEGYGNSPIHAYARPEFLPGVPHCVVRRGFVAEVTCTLADYLAHARDLFAAHPVELVEVTNVEPLEVSGEHWPPTIARLAGVDSVGEPGEWFFRRWTGDLPTYTGGGHGHNLPAAVFDRLPAPKVYPGDDHLAFFPTRAAARDGLSAAAVARGRELAGLNPGREVLSN